MQAGRFSAGGRLLLRIEDIDATRCSPEHVASSLADLAWLGLRFAGAPLLQSTRRPAHDEALARLTALGVTYPCFCSRADIAAAGGAPHAGDFAPYPGTCRALGAATARQRQQSEACAIRLDAGKALALAGPLQWQDQDDALHHADPLAAGDVVLARKDIGVGYMLAAVVDDGFQQVTLIVRGRDLLPATPTQRLLQALLGLPAPRYLHHRLLLSADGRRLAKRDRAETLFALRQRGIDGKALAGRLAALPPTGPDLYFSVD